MDSVFGKNCLHLDEIFWPRRENGDGVMLDTKHLTELLISSSPPFEIPPLALSLPATLTGCRWHMRSISCVLVLYIFFRQILERWSYVVLSACVVSSNVSSAFLFLRQELELLRGKQRQEAQELRSQQRSFFDEAVMVKWK